MPKIIIHPGAPKTATTFLQNEVFDKHPEVLNLGRPRHGSNEHSAFFRALMHEENADDALAMVGEFFKPALAEARSRGLQTIVYSNESLSDATQLSGIVARLHSAIPTAEILITVRNQPDAAASLYTGDRAILKNVPAPYAGKPINLDAWFAHAFASLDTPDAKTLDYWRGFRAYSAAFGTDRVHVLLYEQFVSDRSAFMQRLTDILEVGEVPATTQSAPRVNPTPSARLRAYQSFRSRVLPGRSLTSLLPGAQTIRRGFDNFLKRGQPKRVDLDAAQRSRLVELYADGNKRLAEACKLDLRANGYPV